MSDEKSQQQTSTESTVAGAAKTGKAISNIAKGAAAGGAHGAAIEAGKSSAKWLIPLIAAVLLPLILVAMLPSIIFGSLLGDGTDSPNGISNDEVLVQNMTAINEGISSILSEGLTDVLERIDSDFASSGCDGKEINNPFGADVVFNANAFVSQYCAHKDTDIASISKEDNPQQKLFSLVRSAEVSSVTLRNLTARTVRDDTAPFYCEVADLLGIKVEETHDWLKISVPAILPKRNQRDNQAFLTRPLRYAIMDYLKENPMERFGSCAICIVHNYDAALGKRRIRDYDNIETKRYLDVIESMLLTNDSGLLCTVLQATRMSDRDSAEFYLMRPETLSSWAKNHIKTTTKTCSE